MRPALPIQFHRELELPWRGSGVAAQIAVQRERLPLKPDVQGSWMTPVGDAFELTGLLPCAVHAAFT
jgi:hypothetical protein